MPISGLVVVCGRRQNDVVRAIERDPCCDLGPIEAEGRVPVVLETDTIDQHQQSLRRIERLPGVSMVELVYVDYRSEPRDDEAVKGVLTR